MFLPGELASRFLFVILPVQWTSQVNRKSFLYFKILYISDISGIAHGILDIAKKDCGLGFGPLG